MPQVTLETLYEHQQLMMEEMRVIEAKLTRLGERLEELLTQMNRIDEKLGRLLQDSGNPMRDWRHGGLH